MSKISHIIININEQQLYGKNIADQIICQYPISTSKFGVGSEDGSFKTPLGKHAIVEKIGGDCEMFEVFVGRKPIGQLHDLIEQNYPLPDDVITSRILRMRGLQAGLNLGEGIDSYQRYIYLHGTSDEKNIGFAASHGCVRLRNKDIMELYGFIEEGCLVEILE